MTNEEKARVLSNKGCLGAYISRDAEALNPTEEDKQRLSLYGACLEAMKWKDEQHEQEKRQWIERMYTLINEQNWKRQKNAQTNFKQSLKTTFRNLIERILDATEKMCGIILVLFLWLCAIGLVVFGINVLLNLF